MNSKLRAVPRDEIVRLMRKQLEAVPLQKHQQELGLTQSCLSCRFWNELGEICNKYNQRPPARIIVFSCPEYDDVDDIPF